METLDYKKIKFKSGIEIHAQVNSNKLFCNCPSIIDNEKPDLIIKRKLRAVAGESGKKDIAALYEEAKNKTFIYEYSNRFSCLTCLDEEPAHLLNQHALKIALEIALLLNAKIEPELKILRKTIADGSNVSGFQRTTLIATNGKLKTSKSIVKIPTIYLEEDAARKMNQNNNTVTFRLDRLGTPLIEISTAPDIKDPEHAKETASLIGMIAKSTEKIKGGIGSIRQDLNISIKNGSRVELKGFQDLKTMPKVIEIEVKRQLNLIKNKKEIKPEVRKVEPDLTTSFLRPLPGEARIYIETDVPNIKITSSLLKQIKLPELLSEKTLKLEKKYSLPTSIAKQIIKQNINIEDYTKKYPRLSPKLISHILIETPKEIKTRFKIKPKFKTQDFNFIFSSLNNNQITKQAVIELLLEIAKGKKPSLENYKQLQELEIEKEIEKIIANNPGASINALMGIAMQKFKNKVEGKKLFELLKKLS